jgi:hypothetical protein
MAVLSIKVFTCARGVVASFHPLQTVPSTRFGWQKVSCMTEQEQVRERTRVGQDHTTKKKERKVDQGKQTLGLGL